MERLTAIYTFVIDFLELGLDLDDAVLYAEIKQNTEKEVFSWKFFVCFSDRSR